MKKEYLIILFGIVFAFILQMALIGRQDSGVSVAAPFLHSYFQLNIYLEEILLNILLFLPFGYILAYSGFPPNKTIIFCLATSALIEITQYVFHLGLFEWDDMISNTLGGYIGYEIKNKLCY